MPCVTPGLTLLTLIPTLMMPPCVSRVTSRSHVFCIARCMALVASLISGTMPARGCSTGYYLINYTSCDAATGACWGHSSNFTAAWLGVSTPGANAVFTECCNIAYPGYYSAGGSVGVGVLLPCPGGTYGSQTGLANARCTGNCTAGYYCPAGSVTATQNICRFACVKHDLSEPGRAKLPPCH